MKKLLFGLVFASSLQATSIRLHNEAACPLRAAVYSADGSFLGEVSVPSGQDVTWSGDKGIEWKDKVLVQGPAKSKTPFTVQWICPDGESFSSCEGVSTGALVISSQGTGKKICKKEKK
jgi:hypothetical protein